MDATPTTIPADLAGARAAVDRWLDAHRDVEPDRLRGWGLHLWDAWRRGGPEAEQLLRENVLAQLAGERTLRLAREALDGPIVLIKGLALAPLWPDPACRPAGDVDVLVPDADTAWNHLRSLGWELSETEAHPWNSFEHRRHWHAFPLRPPGGGADLELHRRAAWPLVVAEGGGGVPTADLIASSIETDELLRLPSGISALDYVSHSLVVGASSWGSSPFERLSQLVDILLVKAVAGPDRVAARADHAGLNRLWCQVAGAADAVFFGAAPPAAFRLLGRPAMRGRWPRLPRTRKAIGGLYIAPPRDVIGVTTRRVGDELRQFRSRRG